VIATKLVKRAEAPRAKRAQRGKTAVAAVAIPIEAIDAACRARSLILRDDISVFAASIFVLIYNSFVSISFS
jgi:hypothetical protein